MEPDEKEFNLERLEGAMGDHSELSKLEKVELGETRYTQKSLNKRIRRERSIWINAALAWGCVAGGISIMGALYLIAEYYPGPIDTRLLHLGHILFFWAGLALLTGLILIIPSTIHLITFIVDKARRSRKE